MKVVKKAGNRMMLGSAPVRLDLGFDLEVALGVWKKVTGRVWNDRKRWGVDGVGNDLDDMRITDRTRNYIQEFVCLAAVRWYWEMERQRVDFCICRCSRGRLR